MIPQGRPEHSSRPPAEEVVQKSQAALPTAALLSGQPHTLCPLQLEQFNMLETAISSSSLYNPGSTLNYSQAAMMGLTGSHGSLQDTQQLGYPSHSSIPNIILTGEVLYEVSWERVSALGEMELSAL